jgi:hypothetical protein
MNNIDETVTFLVGREGHDRSTPRRRLRGRLLSVNSKTAWIELPSGDRLKRRIGRDEVVVESTGRRPW